jgi:hypothetical protein
MSQLTHISCVELGLLKPNNYKYYESYPIIDTPYSITVNKIEGYKP